MTTDIQQWLERNIDGFSYTSAAKATGLPFSTVRRHITESLRTSSVAETVIAICRAYDLNPLPALVSAGILTPEEASADPSVTIKDISNSDLLTELLRRTKTE